MKFIHLLNVILTIVGAIVIFYDHQIATLILAFPAGSAAGQGIAALLE